MLHHEVVSWVSFALPSQLDNCPSHYTINCYDKSNEKIQKEMDMKFV